MEKRIKALRDQLHEHNHAYYVLDAPTISDYEFDKSIRELATLEKQYPEYHDPNSPTLRVGGGITKDFPTVVHEFPMYSLDNDERMMNLAHCNSTIYTFGFPELMFYKYSRDHTESLSVTLNTSFLTQIQYSYFSQSNELATKLLKSILLSNDVFLMFFSDYTSVFLNQMRQY